MCALSAKTNQAYLRRRLAGPVQGGWKVGGGSSGRDHRSVCSSAWSGRGLNQVDEVSTGVIENHCGNGTHVGWLTTKLNSSSLESLKFSGDVGCEESSCGNTCVKTSLLNYGSRRETQWLQHQFGARYSIGSGYRKPSKCAHRHVRLLREPKNSRVEMKSFLLVCYGDA